LACLRCQAPLEILITMKTMLIWLDQCIPGMRVAEDVTNDFLATVVPKGTVLNDHIIEKLKNLHCSKIRVYTQSEREIEHNSLARVRAEYGQNMEEMRAVLHDIMRGKSPDIAAIKRVSNSMFARQDDIPGILSCLNQVRDADEYSQWHRLQGVLTPLRIDGYTNGRRRAQQFFLKVAYNSGIKDDFFSKPVYKKK